jgi:8-oxo-dGTP pyrophosphatase MutT (NUDIX family)
MSDHAVTLTTAERERRWPNVRPRDAATMIILDRSGKVPKVLMGKRHPGHKFMPGKFVFPGGRVDPEDRRMSVAGALDQACEQRLMARVLRPTTSRARALALAAIRETFEETGLLFGTGQHGAPETAPSGVWSTFAAQGIFPDLESLTFVARAITPPRRPKRFDTRFFTVDAAEAAAKVEGMVGPNSELIEIVSVTFAEAMALDLPTITTVILKEIAARLEAGFGRHLPVPFYWEKHGAFVREVL